eukprot:TRINITY_DN3045_c0_g4_i1.p1 TRINITY_DN3045_c0_g4~~TRINITY_DN3045_c0_g4_i1.p1  ORF type:complete len:606 (+),score=152.27 TRINITY_DN3045_c0_g4_i1:192-1820(+)
MDPAATKGRVSPPISAPSPPSPAASEPPLGESCKGLSMGASLDCTLGSRPFSVSCATNENPLMRAGDRLGGSGEWDVRTDATTTVAMPHGPSRSTPMLRVFCESGGDVPEAALPACQHALPPPVPALRRRERALTTPPTQTLAGRPAPLVPIDDNDAALQSPPGRSPATSPPKSGSTVPRRVASLSDFGRLLRRESLPNAHREARGAVTSPPAGSRHLTRALSVQQLKLSVGSPPSGSMPTAPPSFYIKQPPAASAGDCAPPSLRLRTESSPKFMHDGSPSTRCRKSDADTPSSRRMSALDHIPHATYYADDRTSVTASSPCTPKRHLHFDIAGAVAVDSEPGSPCRSPLNAGASAVRPLREVPTDFEAMVGGERYTLSITACPREPGKKPEVDLLQGAWEDAAGNAWLVKGLKCYVTLFESGVEEVYWLEESTRHDTLDRIVLMGATVVHNEWSVVGWSDGDDWQRVWGAGVQVDVHYGSKAADGKWFAGTVLERLANGKYRVQFDNGEVRDDVEGMHTRPRDDSAEDAARYLTAPVPAWA